MEQKMAVMVTATSVGVEASSEDEDDMMVVKGEAGKASESGSSHPIL